MNFQLRVDGNVRELADSQFRIGPGFLDPGRVALQSVNFPDRYVRVDGMSLRIDPYEDSDAYGRAASFVRVPGLADPRAMSLRLTDDPTAYVTHDAGRLTISRPGSGRAARESATFRLG